MDRRLILLATTLLLSWLHVAVAKGSRECYSPDGTPKDWLYACYPDRETSHCCADGDFCLDNGACLDAQGDNDFTLEGCTDKNWGKGCGNYCEPSEGGNIYLSYCGVSDWYEPGTYCCGDRKHDCCSSKDKSTFFTIPLFNNVFKAPDVAARSSATASTETVAMAPQTNVPASTTSTDANEGGDGDDDDSSLASKGVQAVAIAVPLGALAIGTAGLVSWLILRKRTPKSGDNGNTDNDEKSSTVELAEAATKSPTKSWTAATPPTTKVVEHYTKSDQDSAWGSPPFPQNSPWPLYSAPSNTPPTESIEPPYISRAELQSPAFTASLQARAMSPQELSAEMRSPQDTFTASPFSTPRHTDSPTRGFTSGSGRTFDSSRGR